MSTRALDVKAALKANLDLLPALADVQRSWGLQDDIEYISVMLGEVTWESTDWATNRSQNEEFRIALVVVVNLIRSDSEECERRATDVLSHIAVWVKANPSLTIPGVVTSALEPVRLASGPADSNYQAIFEAQVKAKVRI